MSTVELSHTVATLERTLAADDALAEAAALDPRLHARATKLRGAPGGCSASSAPCSPTQVDRTHRAAATPIGWPPQPTPPACAT
ncbi:MAG: hypothetical protein R2749_10680 [Acidimicrobiales bacterium]